MIIGISGTIGSGKNEVARYLQTKGFTPHVFSDLIKRELAGSGRRPTRENLREAGNRIREKFGPGELARRMLEDIRKNNDKNSVAIGIRNPEEAAVLRSQGDFRLWFVDAPVELRYERSRRRGRADDFASMESFVEYEKKENEKQDYAMQVLEIQKIADAEVVNDKNLDILHKTIDELLLEEGHKLNEAADER